VETVGGERKNKDMVEWKDDRWRKGQRMSGGQRWEEGTGNIPGPSRKKKLKKQTYQGLKLKKEKHGLGMIWDSHGLGGSGRGGKGRAKLKNLARRGGTKQRNKDISRLLALYLRPKEGYVKGVVKSRDYKRAHALFPLICEKQT